MAAIRTYPTGTLVDLEKPTPDVIHIEDIAHSLSMTCRFAGHCSDFYSVAEHSLLVEQLNIDRFGTDFPIVRENRLAFLLHDASEAYLGDVTSPLKSLLPDYRELEVRWEAVVREKFGLSDDAELAREVDCADKDALEAEQFALCWTPDRHFSEKAKKIQFQCWSPAEACRRFLYRYCQLARKG